MLSKCSFNASKQSSIEIQSSFIIKLYITATQQTQIILNSCSDIDEVIQNCIAKYKLKKQAHCFLKKQIMTFIDKSTFVQNHKEVLGQKNKQILQNSLCSSKNPLMKKQTPLKNIKIGNIDKSKISIQRTPKNAANFDHRRLTDFRKLENSKENPKIYLKKKYEEQKQNMKQVISFGDLHNNKQTNKTETKMYGKLKSAINIKTQQSELMTSNQAASFQYQWQDTPQIKIDRRMKTQSDLNLSRRMKQFSLQDLQKEMNQQVVDIKYQKKIKSVQPQLCNLFHSIIRYNPPKINRIDPRYACFDGLSQKVIKSLHQFLIRLGDDQLNSLDLDNFKLFLIKYRGDSLLNSLK